jgi:hypothetical protein
MNYSRIHARTLEKAAQILGGQAELAAYLHVTRGDLAAWMEGRNVLPTSYFITAVDVIEAGPRWPVADNLRAARRFERSA